MSIQQYHNGNYIPCILGALDPVTIDTITRIANIKWNKRPNSDGTMSGTVSILYNSTKLAGKYIITPKESSHDVWFEYQHQGAIVKEGVYHNDSMVACMELCRENLLTRLAKIHNNMPLKKIEESQNIQTIQESYNQRVAQSNANQTAFL